MRGIPKNRSPTYDVLIKIKTMGNMFFKNDQCGEHGNVFAGGSVIVKALGVVQWAGRVHCLIIHNWFVPKTWFASLRG